VGLGLQLDVPILASIDWASALLVAAALVAVFRFHVGPIMVLTACALAGIVSYLLGLAFV
jgi:chromate transporter